MATLHSNDPLALQALMSETLFSSGLAQAAGEEAISEVQTTVPPVLTSASSQEEFVFQGGFAKSMLFIIDDAQHAYMSAGAYEAFLKTLAALAIPLEDIALLNLATAGNGYDFKRIMVGLQPLKIILLGVDPSRLQLPAIPFNTFQRGKKASVFNTFSFEEMLGDITKKKAFWAAFKNL